MIDDVLEQSVAVPVAMPRSIRAKRIRQARLRWRVLRFDSRVDGFECGSSIS